MRKDYLSPEIISGVIKILDLFAIVAMGAVANLVYEVAYLDIDYAEHFEQYMVTALLGAAFFVTIFQRLGGYRFDYLSRPQWQIPRVLLVWSGAAAILVVLAFIMKESGNYSRGWAVIWMLGSAVYLLLSRGVLKFVIAELSRHGHFMRHIAIVGAGDLGRKLIAKLRETPGSGTKIVGVFDDRRNRGFPSDLDVEFRGSIDDLLAFARKTPVDEIIVALPLSGDQGLRELFDKLKALPADLRLSIEPLTAMFPVHGIDQTIGVPLLEIADRPLKKWNGIIKRIEDAALASLLLVLFAPIMAMIALIIKIDSKGPVFFVQDRFGFNNQPIRVLKFRTMYQDKGDPAGAQRTVRNDPRITRSGRVMRTLSLDELPQLFNVMRGEMSLIGPRAHAIAMRAGDRLYHESVDTYFHRHRVKPGITGWAQVNGLRGEIDSLEKARQRVVYDLEYIERWSLWLDFKILAMSLGVVFERNNAY
jgi:Undecaprenyl-phosphate glucose phosphotransferase